MKKHIGTVLFWAKTSWLVFGTRNAFGMDMRTFERETLQKVETLITLQFSPKH